MASITISVPDPLREWVERRVEGGRFEDASAYVEELIRRDRVDVDERDALNAALERGEASGISPRSVLDILAATRPDAADRMS